MIVDDLRFALVGTGFWSQFQLAAWQELRGAQCVALCNRTRARAETLASRFGIPSVYDDLNTMLSTESLDFVDIVTDVDTHPIFVARAIDRGLSVICQKPLAANFELARNMVEHADRAEVRLLVHENWRWQTPLRRLKQILDSGQLGRLVRARIDYANSFPVFDNQPFLKELGQFILTDIGTHILDVARFLFGEASTLHCQTRRIREDIAGEDVATVLMEMTSGLTVVCNMSYASRWQYDRFPQTMVAVEGTKAGVSLDADYRLTIYGNDPQSEQVRPKRYPWADPAYDLIHASIVDCHRNLLAALRGEGDAETTGRDNLRTLQLVNASYRSAAEGQVLHLAADKETMSPHSSLSQP